MIIEKKKRRTFLRLLMSIAAIGVCFSAVHAKTRWSSLHLVPDADLLMGGEYHIGADLLLARNDDQELLVPQSYLLDLGIIEYVNIELGYSGGFTMGLKARILGENRRFLPSLAVGVHNLFTHKEATLFDYSGDNDPENEFYLALSKSIESIKTRLHVGVQSIPTIDSEKVNPFFAIEKYFGYGLYASFEGYRRFEQFPLSLFVTWRAFNDRLEISTGAVDIQSLFFDANNEFAISLQPEENNTFAGPGIWFGIRFHGIAGFGKRDGFITLEDRLARQQLLIDSLYHTVDSLQSASQQISTSVDELDKSLASLTESGYGKDQLEGILFDKIVTLKNLYAAEPFEPDRVREVLDEIVDFRERAVGVLQEIALDEKQDGYMRMYSITALGEIGNRAASDVLLELIARTNDPDLKVEILIALGKMKETRAMYLMEQLANDPNDAVALTAQEVLRLLSEQTGAVISSDAAFRKIEESATEEKVETRKIVRDNEDFSQALPEEDAQKQKSRPSDKSTAQQPEGDEAVSPEKSSEDDSNQPDQSSEPADSVSDQVNENAPQEDTLPASPADASESAQLDEE